MDNTAMPNKSQEKPQGKRQNQKQSGKQSQKHTWTFGSRFRSGAYGWKASALACQRIKEAVSEIKIVARYDPIEAAEGAVLLLGRLWPALQSVDSSSGALGTAVNRAQDELIPLLVSAPADAPTRQRWLERLLEAFHEDGVQYLWLVENHWGELCASPEVASQWADRYLPLVRQVWSQPNSGFLTIGGSLCLSCLLAAGRHQELWDVLALDRYPFWHYRQFGVRALVQERRLDEALAYAEASRGLNQPNGAIDAACEQILLDAGRSDEAYERYALTANAASTGLATFRALARKYPQRDRRQILVDLVQTSGEPGRWFAAAKEAGFLDLALQWAAEGQTDPRTLIRAARDFCAREPAFALAVGRLAIERILQGYGYEITGAEVRSAYAHCMAAAQALDRVEATRHEIRALAGQTRAPGAIGVAPGVGRAFRELLLRQLATVENSAAESALTYTSTAPENAPPTLLPHEEPMQVVHQTVSPRRRSKPNPLRLI